MKKILLDTGCLISLVDQNRPYHSAVLDYMKDAIENQYAVYISTLSLAEYAQKGNIADIFHAFPDCISLDFNLTHAPQAGQIRQLSVGVERTEENSRKVIAIDSMIISQAIVEAIDIVVTEDINTFSKTVSQIASNDLNLIPFTILHPKDMQAKEKQGVLNLPD